MALDDLIEILAKSSVQCIALTLVAIVMETTYRAAVVLGCTDVLRGFGRVVVLALLIASVLVLVLFLVTVTIVYYRR